ncbi:hypothetical protein RSAG8_09272, partial [Rhizoctonia solani AG-8 WAC10335]
MEEEEEKAEKGPDEELGAKQAKRDPSFVIRSRELILYRLQAIGRARVVRPPRW